LGELKIAIKCHSSKKVFKQRLYFKNIQALEGTEVIFDLSKLSEGQNSPLIAACL
jgi:hypothetical protein